MITYDQITRNAALRITAIVGSTSALKQTAMTTSPMTASQIGTVDFPLVAIQDAVLSSVGRIIRTYANIKSHPFRLFNLSQTAGIAHKGTIPSTNSTSKPIAGAYGAIRDASTGDVLTEQPKQIIETIAANTDNFLKGSYFYYKIIDGRLYHTRTSAVIDVVTFDIATERTAIAINGNVPLPDACFDIAWAASVAMLMIDSTFADQASMHESYVQNQLNSMASGAVDFPAAPALINTTNPGIS